MLNLDIRTLALTTGIIFLVIGANMAYFSAARSTYAGFGFWSLAAWLGGAGMLLLGLRDVLPHFFSVIVANLMIAGYLMAVFVGMAYYINWKPRWVEHAGLMGLLGLGFCYFTYLNPNVNARIVMISLFLAYYCFRVVFIVLRKKSESHLRNNLLLWVIAVLGFYYLLRAGYSGFWQQSLSSFMKAGTFHMIAFLVYILTGFWILIGLLFLGARRLEHDVAEARAEVLQLSGLLPICSNCKKIRDDKGYWQQVESYVSDHSEAQFTHSICPSCIDVLYPDLKKSNKNTVSDNR
jgi:hypothetical protein